MENRDIINRLREIFKLSQEILNVFVDYEKYIFSDKNLFEQYSPFVVYKDYKEEFEELKNRELVHHLIKNDENCSKKQNELLRECKEKSQLNPEFKKDYEELIYILTNAFETNIDELWYINGYLIKKDNLNKFKNLCIKLNVGVGIRVIDNNEAVVDTLGTTKEFSEQKSRIINKIIELEKKLMIEQKQRESFINKTTPDSTNDFKSDSLEIVLSYLGMRGYIDKNNLIELSKIINKEKFSEILLSFQRFGLLNNDDISEIVKESEKPVIPEINQLIAMLAIKNNIDLKVLKSLRPGLNDNEYEQLLYGLHKFNKINDNQLQELLEELRDEYNISL